MRKRLLFLLATRRRNVRHRRDDRAVRPFGAEVHLATATRGEAGMVGDPPVTDREHLGEVRAGELMAAAAILGIAKVHFLGFLDGQLASVPREQLLEHAVGLIRRVRPHVLVGFGPRGSRATRTTRSCARWPCPPSTVPAIRRGTPAAAPPGRPSSCINSRSRRRSSPIGTPPFRGASAKLTSLIDTSEQVETKIRAFHCHKTQAKDTRRILERPGYREFARMETYVLAGRGFPGYPCRGRPAVGHPGRVRSGGRHGGRRDLRKYGIGEEHAVRSLSGAAEGGAQGKSAAVCAIKVPDERVDRMAEIFRPKKVTYISIAFHDIDAGRRTPSPAGLDRASKRRGPRARRPGLRRRLPPGASRRPRPGGGIPRTLLRHRPLRLPRRAEADRADDEGGEAGRGVDRPAQAIAAFERDVPLRSVDLSTEEERVLSGFRFVSRLPTLLILNVGEGEATAETYADVANEAEKAKVPWCACARRSRGDRPAVAGRAGRLPEGDGDRAVRSGPARSRRLRGDALYLLPDGGGGRGARLERAGGEQRPDGGGEDPLRPGKGVHPGRSDLLRRFPAVRVDGEGEDGREAAARGKGVRRQGRDIVHVRFNV